MNILLRVILIAHPFMHYVFFKMESLISRVSILSGIVAVLLIFLFSLAEEKKRVYLPWIWMYALINTVFLGDFRYFAHISIFFMLYTTIASMEIDWEYALKPLGYVCLVVSLIAITQHFGLRQFTYSYFINPGVLGNPTNTAMYIAATSPFLLLNRKQWLWFPIPIVAILVMNSASGLLGIASVIIAYLIINGHHLRLHIFLALCAGSTVIWFDKVKILFNPHQTLNIWMRAMTDFKDFAWFGSGLGNFDGRYGLNNISYYMSNHYWYVLYTLGMFGLAFLIIWLWPHLRNTRQVLPYVSLISVLVMSACSIPLRIYPIMLITAVNLGILYKGGRQ